MKNTRASIYLGDVVTVIRALEPFGEDAPRIRLMIAELLGFDAQSLETAKETNLRRLSPTEPTPTDGNKPPTTDVPAAENAEDETVESTPTSVRWLPSTLQTRKIETPALDAGTLLAHIEPLPRPLAGASESTDLRMADPLFEPAWSRAIFSGLLATWRDGEIDLEALIEKLALHEPIEALPTLPVPTLRRGVQVLVDTSMAMTPFAADQAWTLEQIERVVGRELVKMLSFAGLPERGVSAGLLEELEPYAPPLPGTPVLLLTDLGIARPLGASDHASVDDWMSFACRVSRAGCPLVALLPYAPARWPRQLLQLMTIIHWDARTTPGRLRAVIGRAHHVT